MTSNDSNEPGDAGRRRFVASKCDRCGKNVFAAARFGDLRLAYSAPTQLTNRKCDANTKLSFRTVKNVGESCMLFVYAIDVQSWLASECAAEMAADEGEE